MAKKQQHFCKGCINSPWCQMQPKKGCYTSKKDVSAEEKVEMRKELQKFRKKVAKNYNL